MRILKALAAVTAVLVSIPLPAHAAAKQVRGAVFFRYGDAVDVLTYRPEKGFSKLSAGGLGQFSASPDGRKVAWIDDKGRLHVTGSTGDRVIARGAVAGVPCATPVWSSDSSRIAYPLTGTEATARVAIVGADGKNRRTVGRTYGVCHLAWSANGRYLAGYAGTTDGVYLLDVTTGKSRRAAGIKLANHVQSLSPDGGKVIVKRLGANDEGGDGVWPVWYRPSIVDTVTGASVPVPVKGTLIGAVYLPDGRLVVRVKGAAHNTLVVLTAGLTEVQRIAEPAQARRFGLLGVLP
ncbi:hypothetical protein N5079_19145 [Planotetraspora sp. A-T 1434]|uniref:hypothetical protein n=1 Tax=Planotetraspora sp. A-T 1434 TaxID=2979219 RepID=UPI0021BF9231|nr:hypothetical protein [Planotetraspora sp. A-T 1434]MCT9932322.1 hypothetical protein [Planotetraspora sp. A-T 1434]